MKKPTLRDLLDENPAADTKLLEKSLRLAEKLRDLGFSGSRYRLATPISRAGAADRSNDKHPEEHARHLIGRF
jgi:hypothetical protein